MALLPAAHAQPFRGAAACTPCHPAQASGTSSSHANSLRRTAGNEAVLQLFDGKTVRERTGVTLSYRAPPAAP